MIIILTFTKETDDFSGITAAGAPGETKEDESAMLVEEEGSESDPDEPTCSKFIRKRKRIMEVHDVKKSRITPNT